MPTRPTFAFMPDRAPFDAAQWDRIAECFELAIAMPAGARAEFVATTLGDDPVALQELHAILAEHEHGQPLSIEEWMVSDAPATDALLAVGTVIGAYRVVALIGRGGMGEVYRAERVSADYEQAVAIKVLRAGFASHELMRRFKAERRILARLAHPNIVSIIDGGSAVDGRPYLVMPFVDGVPITDYCASHLPALEARLQLFVQVAHAAQYAHTQLVVHRDIKPSNILVTPAGDARLLDFGIAKLMSDGDTATGPETRSELRLLTPEHAAPEQLRNELVSTATDVYALGVLLYELLTGTKPHRANGRSLIELERAILETEPAPPSQSSTFGWAKRIRGDLDRIVLMALRKEPSRRYTSVAQFADDVDRFLNGLPVSAERDRFGYRARKFIRRNRAAVAAGVASVAMLVVFSISMAWQARTIARERDRAQREQAAAEAVVRFLTSVFARANPLVVPGGDTLRVPQLLLAGETLVDSLRSDPYVQGRILRVLGNMHIARGKLEEAESVMRRAYERMMSTQGSDSLEVARTYHELARAVQSRDGLAKALPMYRESAMRLRRAGAPAADMLVAERELAERTEGLVERQAALERVLKQEGVASSSDSMVRAANLNALGISKLAVGSLHEAMILFEESLSLLDRLLPSNHINRLAVAGNLTVARRDYGDYATAERMAREILSMQTTQVTPNPLSIAAAEEGVATVVAYQGFLEEAEQRLRRALALEEANLRPTHTMIVNTMFNLGTLIATRGRPLEGARLLDSSLTLARRGGGGDLDTIATYDFKAAILLERGETAAALAMLRSIDARMREVYPPGNPFLATHSELLGVAALAASHPAEAIEHFRKASAIRRARAPETNLELTGPECGRGVALARVGRAAEARPLLRGACARYKQFGIHSRLLIRMAERLQ